MPRSRCALLALCLLGSLAHAIPAKAQQATFFPMGPVKDRPRESVPYDLREDGRVVVGFEYERGAVRWKRPEQFETLGTPEFGYYGRAFGISADGRTIVGDWGRYPFRWTPQEGLVRLGGLQGAASDVSADGRVVVGFRSGPGPHHAFRWTLDEGFVNLGTLGDVDGISKANAVSDDGRYIVGRSMTPSGVQHAYRWSRKNGFRDLGSLGVGPSVANGVSYDGRVVVGHYSAPGRRAFVWTAKEGMRMLPSIQDPIASGMDVSDDGSVIVGQARSPFGDAACIWTDGEPRYLSDLLQNHYGIDLKGWFILREITACSGDGTKLVGSGHHRTWRMGFVVTIPPPPTMAAFVAPATIHVATVGETFSYPFSADDSGGEPLTFSAAGLPPNATLTPTPGLAGASLTGLFQWTPTEADLGATHDVHLFVRDAEQRRASLRFKVQAVAAGSPVRANTLPRKPHGERPSEGPFAAPTRAATATAQEMAGDLFAASPSPLSEQACRAADAAQAIGEVVDSLDVPQRTSSPTAKDSAVYSGLRARQADVARLASDRLYRLYEFAADEEALFASAYAYRASLYASMDAVEREMD